LKTAQKKMSQTVLSHFKPLKLLQKKGSKHLFFWSILPL